MKKHKPIEWGMHIITVINQIGNFLAIFYNFIQVQNLQYLYHIKCNIFKMILQMHMQI